MTNLYRNIFALGCFAGFAAVNGCSAQAGPEGSDQQQQEEATTEAPTGEAQEAWNGGGNGTKSFDFCNTDGPASNTPGTCGFTLCTLVGLTHCCTGRFDDACVSAALSFCRSPAFGGPIACFCPHGVCTVGDRLDSGCPGFASPVEQCPALVCDVDPFCCNNRWDSICVSEANSICNASCFGP